MKKIGSIIAILFFLGIFSLFFYSYQINYPLAKAGESQDIIFVIESGQTPQNIANSLEDLKIIKSGFWFRYYLKFNNLADKIIAGTFVISSDMSIRQIVEKITTLNTINTEDKIVLIEGWNSKEMGDYLENRGFCSQEYWLDLVNNYQNGKYDFLSDRNNGSLEGYLFPDTYRVYQNATCDDILVKLLDNFNRKITKQMKVDIASQNKSLFDIITMASVIEKEVMSIEDMKIVSGIFWDRIKNKQALQSCATLAYILGENKAQYSVEDTQIDSPYNTYQNRGLPPGPITNPGLNAIQAAIYPTYTDYNYFLTDPATGNTIWSKTFEEHVQNKWKYLQ